MATKITVPDIGDFENVEIIEILTKPGAIVKKNDPIVTLESDKSSVEVPSPFPGKISSLEVKIGDKVSKGSVLATIEDDKNEISKEKEKLEKPIQTKQRKEKEEPLVLTEEQPLILTDEVEEHSGVSLVSSFAHKPTDTEFVGAMVGFKGAGCDLIVFGTIIRDTITGYATARKLGITADVVVTQAGFDTMVAGFPGV